MFQQRAFPTRHKVTARATYRAESVHTDRRTMAGRPHVMAGCMLASKLATTTGPSDPNTPFTSRNYPNIHGRVENEQLRHAMYGVLAAAAPAAATHGMDIVPVKGAQCLLVSMTWVEVLDVLYLQAHVGRYNIHT